MNWIVQGKSLIFTNLHLTPRHDTTEANELYLSPSANDWLNWFGWFGSHTADARRRADEPWCTERIVPKLTERIRMWTTWRVITKYENRSWYCAGSFTLVLNKISDSEVAIYEVRICHLVIGVQILQELPGFLLKFRTIQIKTATSPTT